MVKIWDLTAKCTLLYSKIILIDLFLFWQFEFDCFLNPFRTYLSINYTILYTILYSVYASLPKNQVIQLTCCLNYYNDWRRKTWLLKENLVNSEKHRCNYTKIIIEFLNKKKHDCENWSLLSFIHIIYSFVIYYIEWIELKRFYLHKIIRPIFTDFSCVNWPSKAYILPPLKKFSQKPDKLQNSERVD